MGSMLRGQDFSSLLCAELCLTFGWLDGHVRNIRAFSRIGLTMCIAAHPSSAPCSAQLQPGVRGGQLAPCDRQRPATAPNS